MIGKILLLNGEAFMYIAFLHSNATSLATLAQTNRASALHMIALAFQC